ncbi:hypothetical protein BDV40DRAFT_85728 [Aspergillus tamarii]|uniref:Uncharacterized protein n=1 Tax=Aspergillus tamarii TaxID=41984 RepID=A0A5N6UCA2_ASPTM|nr:hypothetical protein BDV40DRAFT_85728 [Aspergillus tamarii]
MVSMAPPSYIVIRLVQRDHDHKTGRLHIKRLAATTRAMRAAAPWPSLAGCDATPVKMGDTLSCVSLGATGTRDPLVEGLTANVEDGGCTLPVPTIAEEVLERPWLWLMTVFVTMGLMEPSCPDGLLVCPTRMVLVGLTGLESGTVSVKVVGVDAHFVQTVTVVVQPSAGRTSVVCCAGTLIGSVVGVVTGRVRVTVVGVGAQCVQTVTELKWPAR